MLRGGADDGRLPCQQVPIAFFEEKDVREASFEGLFAMQSTQFTVRLPRGRSFGASLRLRG
jgi:hypothetical protein